MSVRLGFPVKVLGDGGLKSNDTRRWQSDPHLEVSIEYLHAIFDYLSKHRIGMYRMSSDLAPYVTHPDLPQFHGQIDEAKAELSSLGRRARSLDLRLSFHPSQFIVLNAPDEAVRQKSMWDLRTQAQILDYMELGDEAVLVIHVGGSYGDREAAMDRWVATFDELTEPVRRRLVLENDDIRFSAADVWRIHERTGVRLVFDVQHHQCLNPDNWPLIPTFERFLRTWPSTGARPKMHFSSPRTELREVVRKNRKTGKKERVLQSPIWTGHADFVHPFDFIRFARETAHLEFDIMLEAKAKDLALLRLRRDLACYAPDIAPRFGAAAEPEPEIDISAEAVEAE